MKNFFFSLLAGLFISLSVYSQNITLSVNGTVQMVMNNMIIPVADQAVTIMIDSTNTGYSYQNTVYTDQSGYYEDIIALPGNFGYGYVWASTYDSCLGQYQSQGQFFAPGTTITSMDFYLCNMPPNPCMATFYYYPLDPNDPYTYQFANQSTGNFTQVSWSFGDSTYSNEFSPIHTFPGPGTYYVCLTISDGMDCNSTYCEILSTGGGNNGCENYFIYQNSNNDPYTLTFQGFLVNGQYADSYFWDFGDGTTGGGQTVTHTFPSGQGTNGIYMVGLTTAVTDSVNDSCMYTSYQEVWINTPPPPGGCESFILPLNMYGLTVEFEGYTVSEYETQYTWEFGDGITGTGQFVSHTYSNPGMFVVTLHTVDATGCTFQTFQEIWVDNQYQGCSNYFTYEQVDSSIFTFSGIIYLNNGQYYPDSTTAWSWDFGDGTTGTGQTVTHYFQENPAGGYMVCLTTSTILPDGSTCTANYCEQVNLVMPSFSIYGYVSLDNNLMADYGIVHLMTMDTLWQNVVEVGTTYIDSMGFYSFQDIPMYNRCLYYVQAELTQESQYFGQYLPTYHESALTWEEANPVMPMMNWPANIYMIPAGQMQSGAGAISGIVSELGTRGYMSDVEIVLMDPDKNPLAYLKSDDQGSFIFNDLAFGTYIIHAELMGIHTVQAEVTLSTEQPEAAVEVQVSGDQANVLFGVPEQKGVIENVGEIYPNPVNNIAKFDITVTEPVNLSISIFDQTGQVVDLGGISLNAGSHNITVDTGALPAGLYLARITTTRGEMISRKFMKVQ